MNIAILILAAGNSTRMKTLKQLLPIDETTLLGTAINNAQKSKANKVFCILGAQAEKVKENIEDFNIETIYNPNYKSGLSSSIVAGVNYIQNQPFDAIVILLGDQPKVDYGYLDQLIDEYKNNPANIVASNYKEKFGVPAIFPKAYFSKLMTLKGDKGAKELLNSKFETIKYIEASNQLIDIDTKEDYLNYLQSE